MLVVQKTYQTRRALVMGEAMPCHAHQITLQMAMGCDLLRHIDIAFLGESVMQPKSQSPTLSPLQLQDSCMHVIFYCMTGRTISGSCIPFSISMRTYSHCTAVERLTTSSGGTASSKSNVHMRVYGRALILR